MFADFVIQRELFLKENSKVFYSAFGNNNSKIGLDFGLPMPLLSDRFVAFSKPKLVYFLTNSFFVLSNGALIFVDVSFNKAGAGTLLFDDLYC